MAEGYGMFVLYGDIRRSVMPFQTARLDRNWSTEIAVKHGRVPSSPSDVIDIYFFGMRRSGNHGVIKWLLGQFDHLNPEENLRNRGVFYNDYNNLSHLVPVEPRKDKVRLVSYEDDVRLLSQDHRDELLKVDNGVVKHCFVLLRNPLNWYPSYRVIGKEHGWSELTPKSGSVEMLLRYFEDFYMEPKDRRVIPIVFDRWFKDPSYRKAIAETIVDAPNDRGFGIMDPQSPPSSFEGWTHANSASKLGVLDRWKNIPEEELKMLLENERLARIVKELSQ
jgi:ASC-1-like (ASCH) protein